MMAVPTGAVLLIFALMSLLHAGVSFRQTPSNRHQADEQLGKTDYIRLRNGVRDRYVLGRVLQAVAEIEGIQAMVKLDRDIDIKENSKRSAKSRPIKTSYLSRLPSKRNADLRENELTGGAEEQWPEEEERRKSRREGRSILDGQIEWLFSRVYPWRVSDNDDDSESYFGNHVDLIGSSIIG